MIILSNNLPSLSCRYEGGLKASYAILFSLDNLLFFGERNWFVLRCSQNMQRKWEIKVSFMSNSLLHFFLIISDSYTSQKLPKPLSIFCQIDLSNSYYEKQHFWPNRSFQFLRLRWVRLDRDQRRGDEEPAVFDSGFDLCFTFSRLSGNHQFILKIYSIIQRLSF